MLCHDGFDVLATLNECLEVLKKVECPLSYICPSCFRGHKVNEVRHKDTCRIAALLAPLPEET
jgi:hypothetical protein